MTNIQLLHYARVFVQTTILCHCRNGPEFEARIRQNEINNPKFNFLNPNDPYHAYYRHKVNEFKEGKAQEPSAAVPKVMQQTMQQTQQLPQKVVGDFGASFVLSSLCPSDDSPVVSV